MKTIRICLYEFEELSPSSKKVAIDNHRQSVIDSEIPRFVSKAKEDMIESLDKDGIHGITQDIVNFDDENKIISISNLYIAVEGKFFLRSEVFGVEENAKNAEFNFVLNYQGNGKGPSGMNIKWTDENGGSRMFGAASFLEGWIGGLFEDAENQIESKIEYYSNSDRPVSNVLEANHNLYFRKDGSDVDESIIGFANSLK